ncbi:hypothetical protein B9Z55_018548 [Caenorhabditis nigoni]|nr:hypothetical protein B9Z55_018548 [Caenorhabditis nigoni]
MELSRGEIEFELKSGPMEDYTKVVAGRKGKIFSPSIWNQHVSSSSFINFTATEPVKFVLNVDEMNILRPGTLLVEVGQPHSFSVPKFFKLTPQSYRKEAIGTYMAVTFTGTSKESSFALKYNVEAISSTTNDPMEWAAMNSSFSAGFSLLVLIVAWMF